MPRLLPLLLGLATAVAAAAGHETSDGWTIAIAPLDEALTFARVRSDGALRTIAVRRYEAGVVEGLDLGTVLGHAVPDPIDALRAHGWTGLRDRIAAAPASARVTAPADRLGVPVELRDHHVAAGTNYPEHAGEASVEDGPFLFAKLVRPTGPRAPVPVTGGLLDYEVELAFVTLDPVAPGERPGTTGLVVCNDYTDRALLLRHVDVSDPASGDGFTTGKSAPGWLPVGDLFVVPRDVRDFVRSLELVLLVNDERRQAAPVTAWIWDLDRILAETWARRGRTWEHAGGRVALLPPDGTLPDRTLLMAGTPAGTVFQGIGLATRARGALAWLAGGWDVPLTRRVIETYVREEATRRSYLQPGDRVVIRAHRLGVVDNVIVP